MAWEPVEDGRYGETGRVCLYASGRLIQVAHGGVDPLTDVLPDDIRLCRQVRDAPVQGVQIPSEVAETIRLALKAMKNQLEYVDWWYDSDDDYKAGAAKADAALAWLAQAQGE